MSDFEDAELLKGNNTAAVKKALEENGSNNPASRRYRRSSRTTVGVPLLLFVVFAQRSVADHTNHQLRSRSGVTNGNAAIGSLNSRDSYRLRVMRKKRSGDKKENNDKDDEYNKNKDIEEYDHTKAHYKDKDSAYGNNSI